MKIFSLRTLFITLLSLGLLAGGGYAGYHGYVSARQTRLVKQAQNYLAKVNQLRDTKQDFSNQFKKAQLCLQRVLLRNPKQVEACRLMAELNDIVASPGALLWRSRVVELNPNSLDDRLALAQTALAMRQMAIATNALEGVSQAGKKTAAYHNVAGAVASTINQLSEAEVHFLEAARLDATNPVPRLNLAVIRLQRTNEQAQAEARATLQQLRANPALCCQALRELAIDAVRHRQTNAALTLSGDLLQQTNSSFTDRLLRLDILRGTQSPEFKPALAAFRREAGTNENQIAELATWQMNAAAGPPSAPTLVEDVLAWLDSLPMSLQTNLPVARLSALCHMMLGREKDWQIVATSLERQNWDYPLVKLEFMRYAYRARALREQHLGSGAKVEWDRAVKSAQNLDEDSRQVRERRKPTSSIMLLGLAADWNWQSEAEEILWNIVNRFPAEKWAVRALESTLFASGRTRSLMTLLSQQVKTNPSNLSARNNLALTALLLDAKELKPHDLAREAYQKAPANAAYASTCAFSLLLQDKNAEAAKLLEQLKPQPLEDPSVVRYCGLVLKPAGDGVKAKKYEDILWQIVNRYPGEKWAVSTLSEAFFASGRTRSLMNLLYQQMKTNPSDLAVKNNLAMTALLLDAKELQPHDLAREVYTKAPTNSFYASTYAFSLHLQQKSAEALQILETLKPQELEVPSMAGYYGLVLKATGNSGKAKKYLDLASKAKLLPEEQKLMEKARMGI